MQGDTTLGWGDRDCCTARRIGAAPPLTQGWERDMKLVCRACDEVFDESFWDDDLKMCEECASHTGSDKYHCGAIHDADAVACMSCGEPI